MTSKEPVDVANLMEHVDYELEQFDFAFRWLAQRPAPVWNDENSWRADDRLFFSVLEAGLAHARNLLEFFEGNGKSGRFSVRDVDASMSLKNTSVNSDLCAHVLHMGKHRVASSRSWTRSDFASLLTAAKGLYYRIGRRWPLVEAESDGLSAATPNFIRSQHFTKIYSTSEND